MAPRSSPGRSKATGTKPRGTKKNSTTKSVNGKSSPKKTKPRALNHVQWYMVCAQSWVVFCMCVRSLLDMCGIPVVVYRYEAHYSCT